MTRNVRGKIKTIEDSVIRSFSTFHHTFSVLNNYVAIGLLNLFFVSKNEKKNLYFSCKKAQEKEAKFTSRTPVLFEISHPFPVYFRIFFSISIL